MAAIVGSLQQFLGPLLVIGLITGVLALIPMVGGVLGVLVFVLALKYTGRNTLSIDLMTTLAIWIAIRALAIQLHIV